MAKKIIYSWIFSPHFLTSTYSIFWLSSLCTPGYSSTTFSDLFVSSEIFCLSRMAFLTYLDNMEMLSFNLLDDLGNFCLQKFKCSYRATGTCLPLWYLELLRMFSVQSGLANYLSIHWSLYTANLPPYLFACPLSRCAFPVSVSTSLLSYNFKPVSIFSRNKVLGQHTCFPLFIKFLLTHWDCETYPSVLTQILFKYNL